MNQKFFFAAADFQYYGMISQRKSSTKMEKNPVKSRPKSFPNQEILSSGSSDSGLESDNISIVVTMDGGEVESASPKSLPEFNFGEKKTHKERMNNLQNALDWVRNELTEMKSQDKHLARTMIDLRSKIQQLKLDLESCNDNGYDSDVCEPKEVELNTKARSPTSILSCQHILNYGEAFENNKRATWAI